MLWFGLWNFFLQKLCSISLNTLFGHAWNTAAMLWASAPKCYLDILNRFQNCVCKAVDPSLSNSLKALACWCGYSESILQVLFWKMFHWTYWVISFSSLLFSVCSICWIGSMTLLFLSIDIKEIAFFHTSILWSSLLISFFWFTI